VGKLCKTHYRGTLNDGTVFDSSYDRGEPLEFICGVGMMISGYDAAVANMEVGQSIDIHLTPDQAYGPSNPGAIFTVPISELPGSEELSVGEKVVLHTGSGQPLQVRVSARDDSTITFDANHEMAGKDLNFHIELIEVQ
jgi:FKBP-type peptidyl-prolyl cis-trans isomerase 2